jgi:SAM-dependent methyltransferase
LELACGTGRVLIPVAEAGVQVIRLDGSPGMLEKLRDKLQTLPVDVRARLRVLKGDMRSFDLGRQFAFIYIPARSFLHLMTVDDQKAALGCIHRHLQDDGRLALNFFNPSLSLINEAADRWRPFVEGREFVNERGNRVMVWNTRRYDTVNQVIEQYTIYDEIDEGGRVVDRRYMPLTLRWIYRFEFEHLLATCGFAVEALYGTFDREPFSNERQELIWVARKV